MGAPRLFVSADRLAAGALRLDGDDHHYLFRVRRLTTGAELTLFDGQGRRAHARVEHIAADTAIVRVDEPEAEPTPARPHLAVALALIKGERMEWCVQKLVELGVDELVPFTAHRSVVRLSGERAERRRERFEAIARDAARQCRRATVPSVAPIGDLDAALARTETAALKLLCWERSDAPVRERLAGPAPGGVAVLVGPEGGFEADEVDRALARGYAPIGLGPRILRAETAAIAAAAVIQFALGDLNG